MHGTYDVRKGDIDAPPIDLLHPSLAASV